MCSVATILDERTDTKENNLPKFHFHRQPKPSLRHQMLYCELLNGCCWKFQPGHFLALKHNSADHWTSHTKCIFSRLAKAPKQINLFICVATIAVLLSINKATTCISSRFYSRTIVFAILVCGYFWCENASAVSSDILCHQV